MDGARSCTARPIAQTEAHLQTVPIRAIHGKLSNHGNAIPSVWVDVYDNAQLCLDNSLTPGRVTNARQESDLGRAAHAVAAEIRPTTMAPSKMKSEVARSGLVIIK